MLQSRSSIDSVSAAAQVRQLWCSVLHLDQVPDDTTSWFALGGSSLALIQLFTHYQHFFSPHVPLNMLDFLIQPTIAKHVRLLTAIESVSSDQGTVPVAVHVRHEIQGKQRLSHSYSCARLMKIVFIVGPLSFAQERIRLDDQIRSGCTTLAVHNALLVFVLSAGSSLSLPRLRRTLSLLVQKHGVFRTCVVPASDNTHGEQRVVPFTEEMIPLVQVSKAERVEQVQKILMDEETNREHFDLVAGRLFRCHAIRTNDEKDQDILFAGDLLLFNFHQLIFDGSNEVVFLADLKQAYATGTLQADRHPTPTYIDYAMWQRDGTSEENLLLPPCLKIMFKEDAHNFPLPYDRRPLTSTRHNHGSSFKLKLDRSEPLLAISRRLQASPFQVCLSAYYVFLYKLTQGQDVLLDILTRNQFRPELSPTLGLFSSWIPCPLQVEPSESFGHLIERAAHISLLVTTHVSAFNREVIKHCRENTCSPPYITTGLKFESITSTVDLADDCALLHRPHSIHVVQHDLCLAIKVDECEQVTGTFEYASDVFDAVTIATMAHRFECLLDQIFTSSSASTPVCEFSLLLPSEVELQHQLCNNNHFIRPQDLRPIHQQFVSRAEEHPQKLSIVLEDQSLTYAELHHAAQLVATHLIDECHVEARDIVAQCVERSIEMSIGMLGILVSGGSYCPLSSDQPPSRLQSLIDEVQPRCLLVHHRTKSLFTENIVDIEEVLYLIVVVVLGECGRS